LETQNSSLKSNLFVPPVNQTLVKVLVDFIKQELGRFGINKAVVGLSGGIDSSVVAYLAVKALGKTKVTGLILPYKTSSKSSISDAFIIAEKLGIKTKIIDLTPSADSLVNSIGDKKLNNVRKGNILARLRMICLYDYSGKTGGLVLGTGNKTEILLGYTTLFGDSAYAINPIGDLYKTQVWQLAELLKIPKSIIKKKPSADLWVGQTDEQELGFTYKEADKFLFYLIDCHYSDKELKALGYKPEFIKRVKSLIRKNQFKRVPPPIAKVSNRTVNIDFRYNRDWGS
jgi:NAD+ synthase